MAHSKQATLASLVPGNLRPHTRAAARRLREVWMRLRYRGARRFCPVCGSHVSTFLPHGVIKRLEARCPVCGAMERHRLIWLFFQRETKLFQLPRKRMLHIAPEAAFLPSLSRNPNIDYLSGDYAPGRAMVQMDITDIPYPDDSFDVVYCSHVLEHVLDDRRAMRELRRVLKPSGWAVLQVPLYRGPTFEDNSVTDPSERERVFGQWDHVRRYGDDYRQRLEEAGFLVRNFKAEEIATAAEIEQMNLHQEDVFFCSKPA